MQESLSLDKIVTYTPVDKIIKPSAKHNYSSAAVGFASLILYLQNLDDDAWQNIFTDYAGVLVCNFAISLFAGREFFKDQLQRQVPEELKGILIPSSQRTTLITIGALAGGFPYGAMAWETSAMKTPWPYLSGLVTWLVNAFMNNIPVRVVLDNSIIKWLLFFPILLPVVGIKKCLFPSESPDLKIKSRQHNQLRQAIVARIDDALEKINTLDEEKIIGIYNYILKQQKEPKLSRSFSYNCLLYNVIEVILKDPVLEYKSAEVSIQFPVLEEKDSLNTPLISQEYPKSLCFKQRTQCADGLHNQFIKIIILVFGAVLAAAMLLSDAAYVKDAGEDIGEFMGLSSGSQKISAWLLVYIAMSVAFVIFTDFCNDVLKSGKDWVAETISPKKIMNFSSRFYPKSSKCLNAGAVYLSYFSSAAGTNLFRQKIPNPAMVLINSVALKVFNARALFGLIEGVQKEYAERSGTPSAQALVKIIHFFDLLKQRIKMMDGDLLAKDLDTMLKFERDFLLEKHYSENLDSFSSFWNTQKQKIYAIMPCVSRLDF